MYFAYNYEFWISYSLSTFLHHLQFWYIELLPTMKPFRFFISSNKERLFLLIVTLICTLNLTTYKRLSFAQHLKTAPSFVSPDQCSFCVLLLLFYAFLQLLFLTFPILKILVHAVFFVLFFLLHIPHLKAEE